MKKNIIDYFKNTILENQNKIAVIDGDKKISFSELDLCAKNLAFKILSLSQCKNTPIAVFLPKSINAVIANIGISYSGNFYMNLDIKSPQERVSSILELIKPKFVITSDVYEKKIEEIYPKDKIINISKINLSCPTTFKYEPILRSLIDTDPYCIINTSGSTGTPKGVVLNHRSFIDFVEWSLAEFDFSDDEVIGSLSPLIFDIYSYELCLLIAKSATLVIIQDKLAAFPIKILECLERHSATFIFWVPTIMVNIANLDLLKSIRLPALKLVWFAGEVFPTKQFNYWRNQLSRTTFVNLYGPIEITLDCTYYIVNRVIADDEPIPIGSACLNTDLLILNDDGELVTDSGEGELCVRGTSLAMGYYNNPELTKKVFIQNPLNHAYPELIYKTGDIVCANKQGEIIYKGRKDTLIKHSGYRIELTEIEHVVVNRLKLVGNCCAFYDHDKKQIGLIYEAVQDIETSIFRNEISKILPKYMIPSFFKRLDQMPMNPNGKIDRLKLKTLI